MRKNSVRVKQEKVKSQGGRRATGGGGDENLKTKVGKTAKLYRREEEGIGGCAEDPCHITRPEKEHKRQLPKRDNASNPCS